MFERYTEKARRTIFFGRFEASQFGSPFIETEHLLLGLLREDKALTHRFLQSTNVVESIRKQVEGPTTGRVAACMGVDKPAHVVCGLRIGIADSALLLWLTKDGRRRTNYQEQFSSFVFRLSSAIRENSWKYPSSYPLITQAQPSPSA